MTELDIKRKASDLLHKGRYQEAIAEYEALLAEMKKPNPAILNLIGDLQVKQGDFEKGFDSYIQASRTYADEGLFHNGIAVGKKVLRLDKDQIELYGMLGQLYARQGLGMDCVKFLAEYARRMEAASEYPAALASFAEACEILPDFPDIHALYGEMLEKVDRNEDAAQAFESAAAACSEREMHAECEQWMMRARAARGEVRREDSGDVGTVADLMSLRNLDEPLAAEGTPGASPWSIYDPARNPDIPPPPPLPGRSASTITLPAIEAPTELAPAATADPPGTIELELEAPAAAISPPKPVEEPVSTEEAAAELNDFFGSGAAEAPVDKSERAVIVGDDFELVREGGDVHEVINDFMEATMELLDLDDHQSHYDLGTTYMEMELFDEAAQEFEISARGQDFALASQEMLGYCFLRKGQIDMAIRELEKGLAHEGYDDRDKLGLLYNLGVASRVVDQEQQAIEYFRRILEIDPNFRDTKDRLERLVEN